MKSSNRGAVTIGSGSDKLMGGTAGPIMTKRCTKQLYLEICNFKPKCLEVVFWGGQGGVTFILWEPSDCPLLNLISTSYNKMVPKSYKPL